MRTRHVVAIVMTIMLAMIVVLVMTVLAIDRRYTPSKEALLVSQVQGKYPEATNWPSDTIINIAKDTCSQLDSGATIRGTINNIAVKYPVGAEADYDLIAFTMVTGIRELCPRHLEQAKEFSNG